MGNTEMKDLRTELLMTEEREIDQFGKRWNTSRSLRLLLLDEHGDTTDSFDFDVPRDIGEPALLVAPDGGSLLIHFTCPCGEYLGVHWAVFQIAEDRTLNEAHSMTRWPTSERAFLEIEQACFLPHDTPGGELTGRITYSRDAQGPQDTITAEEKFEHFTVAAAKTARAMDYSVRTKIVEKPIKVRVIETKEEFDQLLGPSGPADTTDGG